MASSLEEVLKGTEAPPEVVEAVAEPEAEVVEETVDVQPELELEAKGEEEPEQVEPEPEVETPAAKESREVPLAALLDERDKRKAEAEKARVAEARLAELEETNAKVKTDFYEDPDKAMSEALQEQEGRLMGQFRNGLLAYSMEAAKYRHEDYDDALNAYVEAAQQNGALAEQVFQAGDPGEYIYKTGKQFLQLDAAGGDLDSMRDQIRNEIKAELLKEQAAKESKLKNVPQSLTDETSASAPREKPQGGPTPLGSIFSNQR